MAHYSSFILRLWVDSGDGWQWGLVQHVATRDKLRFKTVPELLEFIAHHSGADELSLPFVLDGSDSADDLEGLHEIETVSGENKSGKAESAN